MAYTVAITNQKGGVGKTTTAVNLAAAIAIAERRTLLVDADPQGNTTSGVGIAKMELQLSLYDALVEGHPIQDVILPVPGLPYLSVLPATQDLVGAELQLVERPFRESALRRVLEPLEGNYDYIIVDCPPSLGLLTLNVLAAVQALIIPIQCEYYGLEGISQLLNTVRLVQQNINPGLAIAGVLLTMYDSRLNLCRQVAEDATEYFGPKVFGTPIPRNVRLAEAPSFGKPILLYDMQSVGAKSYLAVGQELLRRVEGAEASVMPGAGGLSPAASAPAESSYSTGPDAALSSNGSSSSEVRTSPRQDADSGVAIEEVSTEEVSTEEVAGERGVGGERAEAPTAAPGSSASSANALNAEAPDASAPNADASHDDAPDASAPDASAPNADDPNAETGIAEVRAADVPGAEVRGADVPGAEGQGAQNLGTEDHRVEDQNAEGEKLEDRDAEAEHVKAEHVKAERAEDQHVEAMRVEPDSDHPRTAEHTSAEDAPDSRRSHDEATDAESVASHAIGSAVATDPAGPDQTSDREDSARQSAPPSEPQPEVTR